MTPSAYLSELLNQTTIQETSCEHQFHIAALFGHRFVNVLSTNFKGEKVEDKGRGFLSPTPFTNLLQKVAPAFITIIIYISLYI